MKKIIFLIILIFSNSIFSMEVQYLGRSPRALLMGDAYTAIADDEYTLFYNPAALGRNKEVSFVPLDPAIGMVNPLDDLSRLERLPTNNAPAIASRLMDFPVYAQASAFPSIKMGQFGLTLFLNNRTSFVLRNATHPMIDIDYRYDSGFITGFAFNIGSGGSSKKGKKNAKSQIVSGKRLSVGFAVKHLTRQGIANQFDLFGTTLLNKIAATTTDIATLKAALGYSKGSAWGYDTGIEYAQSQGNTLFTAGMSIMDIATTRFNRTQGTGKLPNQDMLINTGVAFKQDFGIFDYTLSADLHPFLGPVDFARQLHLGTEVSFPFITLLAGLSEGYVSYGASVKLWPIKITTGLYSVESGSKYKEQESKRFILYLSLFDFSIDI